MQTIPKRLLLRAFFLSRVRQFFQERKVLEVDTPLLKTFPSIDANIDPIETITDEFLITSPEYAMKELLAEGSGDIYQLCHVFRKGDKGSRHSPEFTMIEWYRQEVDFSFFIKEVYALFKLFLGETIEIEEISYGYAFKKYADVDYLTADLPTLLKTLKNHGVVLGSDSLQWSIADCLDLLLSTAIEPHLGRGKKVTLLTDFPADKGALASIKEKNGILVAERFEFFYEGMELGNGFHELCDETVIRSRFEEENRLRLIRGQKKLPLDESFLSALKKGFPDSYGVAVGFDRLLMLHAGVSDIKEILSL